MPIKPKQGEISPQAKLKSSYARLSEMIEKGYPLKDFAAALK